MTGGTDNIPCEFSPPNSPKHHSNQHIIETVWYENFFATSAIRLFFTVSHINVLKKDETFRRACRAYMRFRGAREAQFLANVEVKGVLNP